jgi:hypothetical protein
LLGCAAACRPAPEQADSVCAEAEHRLGHRVCVHQIPDDDTWTAITFRAAAVDQARATTYLVPIAATFPVDQPVPYAARVLFDTEWKLRSDGRLAIKQIRPFLE